MQWKLYDPCKWKGHDWQLYGWSVMGFGVTRNHFCCSRCKAMIVTEANQIEQKDEPQPD